MLNNNAKQPRPNQWSRNWTASTSGQRTYNKADRAPDAMDVDRVAVTKEEKDELRKDGLCFVCNKPGHMARDHYNGKLPPVAGQPARPPGGFGPNRNQGTRNVRQVGLDDEEEPIAEEVAIEEEQQHDPDQDNSDADFL